jgi:hypothetical protein
MGHQPLWQRCRRLPLFGRPLTRRPPIEEAILEIDDAAIGRHIEGRGEHIAWTRTRIECKQDEPGQVPQGSFFRRAAVLDLRRMQADPDQCRDFLACQPTLSGVTGRWQGDQYALTVQPFTMVMIDRCLEVLQLWEDAISISCTSRVIAAFIAAAAASAPIRASAQGEPLRISGDPPAEISLDDQARTLGANVTTEIRANRISPGNANLVQRELNGVQSQIAADRDRHGGRLTVAERIDLQGQIDKIADEIRKDTGIAGSPAAE